MVDLSPNILIITLSVESSNVSIKTELLRMEFFKWPNYMLSTKKAHFKYNDVAKFKVKG